jgi:arsenite methyltransferase
MSKQEGNEKIRATVSKAYANAILRQSSCCGPTCCSPQPAGAGAAATTAGYTDDQLSTAAGAEAVPSFGCGNPVAFTEVQAGDVVVDLGSGAGLDLLLASKAVGPGGKVVGVDMTDEMIERARKTASTAGAQNIEIRKGIIEDLPVESATVDHVISNCVINLSPEKPRVFAEIARVLRPGGRMVVSDIVVEDFPDELRDLAALRSACIAGAVGEAEYLGGLREAGLEAVAVADRFTYDGPQIAAILASELDLAEELQADLGERKLEEVCESLAGKVHSVRVHARKPKA